MPAVNIVIIAGNLTRDPEIKYTLKGTAICNLSVAVNRKWLGDDGEQKEEVTFVECTAWQKTAETIGQYLKKGDPILVEGRLTLEQWEDKQSGEKRQKLKVTVGAFQFLSVKGGGEERDREEKPKPRSSKPAEIGPKESSNYCIEDDDVPF